MGMETTPRTGKRQIVRDDVINKDDLELQPLMETSSPKSPPGAAEGSPPSKEANSQEDTTGKDRLNLATNPLLACSFYSFCSVSMVLTNKSLASSYNHLIEGGDLNILLVVFQAVVAVVAVESCRTMKWIDYPPLTWSIVKQWAPVNLFFCAMLFTGMASLEHNSVPMVTIFKNVTNIVTFAGDFMFFGAKAEFLVILAFAVMLSGAVAAAWNDITVTWAGCLWMVLNCLSTSSYVLYMKFATKHVKLSKFGMVYANNVLACVFLLPAALMRGEVSLLAQTPALHTIDYSLKNIFAGLIGFVLNFASLNCVAATGPTTYAIVGSLNKVPVALLGYVLFDNAISGQTWFFIAVSMTGGFLFSYAKLAGNSKKTDSTTSSSSSKELVLPSAPNTANGVK